MTQMSEPDRVTPPRFVLNRLKLLGRSHLVQRVHCCAPVLYVVVLGLLLAACVIPPSLSVSDGGTQDAPPAILAVSSDTQQLPFNGSVTFGVGQKITGIVTLVDTDVDDTLTVRWFVNYQMNPSPQRVECFAPPSGAAQRSATCDLSTLCENADVNTERDLTVVVFDRPLITPGDPPFQQMQAGGLSTNVFFHLDCFQ